MTFFGKLLKILKPVFLNKYFFVIAIFMVFVTFFDNHSLIQRWESYQKIKELQKEYDYFENEIKENKEKIKKLKTDDEYLEKVAREQYHMKSKDEDLFIIK